MIRSPAIAAIVAGLVALDEELQRAEAPGDVYRSDGPRPTRTSRESFNRRCASGEVEGAHKIDGRGAGYWECTREAWHRARARRPALRLVEQAPQSDDERAADLLQAAGYRFTKGKR